VAEHALSLILALNGRLLDRRRRVRQGHWSESRHFALLDPACEELSGQTLGVIGYGQLGKALSARAKALGMTVVVAERAGRSARTDRQPFERVLQIADVLSLHCPLTPETENLINADCLAQMPSNALLINTARGGLVNDSELLDALKNGHIAGAGIDVLDSEPPPAEHPLLTADLPNLIVTPHCAWAARGARQRLVDQLAEVVSAFGAGELLNCVE
jgi:glycerate dehydrogenase